MGLFKTKDQAKRQSGEFRWPFKPIDPSAQPRPKPKHKSTSSSLKIGNPVLVQSTQGVNSYPAVPHTARLEPPRPRVELHQRSQSNTSASTSHKRTHSNVTTSTNTSSSRVPSHFEPLWRDSLMTSTDEPLPYELSAKSAAKFHDYLEEIRSGEPSAANSDLELEEVEIPDVHDDYKIATPISLFFPGKPRLIDLSPPSSFGSSRSAASSSSDVRTSGFLESRRNSDDSHCDTPYTPYTPASFFDTSDDSTPSEEDINQMERGEIKKVIREQAQAQHKRTRSEHREAVINGKLIQPKDHAPKTP